MKCLNVIQKLRNTGHLSKIKEKNNTLKGRPHYYIKHGKQ